MKIEIGDNISIVCVVTVIMLSLAYCIPQLKEIKHPEFEKCFEEKSKDYPICHQKVYNSEKE